MATASTIAGAARLRYGATNRSKCGDAARESAGRPWRYLPVSTPRPSGDQGSRPSPSAAQAGSTSRSMPRSSSEYSTWAATTARTQHEADSAPPSIPSAAAVFSEDSTRAATSTPVLPGHVIANRYEVLSVLGEGGMGIVYRCRDQANGEQVAVKRVIPPDGNLADEYVMWFYKEARALAALDHPNIVRRATSGSCATARRTWPWSWSSGASLHELAHAAHQLSADLDRRSIRSCPALAHAHARGIVHGDLKPSNVLVERIERRDAARAHAWISAWPGCAKTRTTSGSTAARRMEFAPHAGAGTPGYMAPEQIQHEMHHVCGATDLYSLGCILYRLLPGMRRSPASRKSCCGCTPSIECPSSSSRSTRPKRPAAFVTQLLAKKPWDRFEFAAARPA